MKLNWVRVPKRRDAFTAQLLTALAGWITAVALVLLLSMF